MKLKILFIVLAISAASGSGICQTGFEPAKTTTVWKLQSRGSRAGDGFKAQITFSNPSEIPSSGWRIYFSLRYHGNKLASLTPAYSIHAVSGELFYIQPEPEGKGGDFTITFTGKGRIANYQDLPSGLFWVNNLTPQEAIAMTTVTAIRDEMVNKLSDSSYQQVYHENQRITDLPEKSVVKIFPTPASYQEVAGNFILDPKTKIALDAAFENEQSYLTRELEKLFGSKRENGSMIISAGQKASNGHISIIKSAHKSEAYDLTVSNNGITIRAGDGAGVFYAFQSLKSLMPPDAWDGKHKSVSIPAVTVSDEPRFPHRAFMLDVGRNFQSKEQIFRILEVMSIYKLNVFHFHLNDDEGWRIEIPGLPELTEVGAQRGYPFGDNRQLHPSYGSGPNGKNSQGSGFYTRQDYVEILRYATERHIRVIPEIESPGHAHAAVKAMDKRYEKYDKMGQPEEASRYLLHEPDDKSTYLSNQYFTDNTMNVALPSTYRFVEKVIDEIKFMYAEAGAPLSLLHMAGDEVPDGTWMGSPAVKRLMAAEPSIKTTKDLWRKYFNTINTTLKSKGLSLYGWEELVLGTQTTDAARSVIVNTDFVRDKIQVDAWWNIYGNENIPYELANTGYKVVLSFFDYFYFDLAYRPGFDEPGDGWVGYLDIEKIFSFIPYDYYRNDKNDLTGAPYPPGFFDKKVSLTESGRKNIVGIQSALWGENLNDPSLVEYQLLPKLLAMAERSWAMDPAWASEKNPAVMRKLYENDWSKFINTVGKREMPRLDYYNGGYGYRVPGPGFVVTNGKVSANVQFPGYQIRYTTDGKEPLPASLLYSAPLPLTKGIKFRTFSKDGKGSVTVTTP